MTVDQLNSQELRLIELVRALPASAVQEVTAFAAAKAAPTPTWNYDDPASCAESWNRAMDNPAFVKAARDLHDDFAFTEGDGLEEPY